MRTLVIVPALLALTAPAALAFDDVVVSPRGTIGPVQGHTFRIGRATERVVRRVEGRPDEAVGVMSGRGTVAGRELTYRLRIGRSTCYRTYEFTSQPGRTLQDFQSNCRYLRTVHGTRVGMTFARAEANEGASAEYGPMPLCTVAGYGISVPSGQNTMVVWLKEKPFFDPAPPAYRNVVEIALYGPRSVSVAASTKSPSDCEG